MCTADYGRRELAGNVLDIIGDELTDFTTECRSIMRSKFLIGLRR